MMTRVRICVFVCFGISSLLAPSVPPNFKFKSKPKPKPKGKLTQL